MISEQLLHTCDNIDGVYERVRIANNKAGGLDPLVRFLEKSMAHEGQKITIIKDKIQSGSLFKKSYEDCIIMRNAKHGGSYYQFVFTYTKSASGNEYYYIYSMGTSTNMSLQASAQEMRAQGGFMNRIAAGMAGPKKEALLEEEEYYEAVNTTLRRMCGTSR